MKPRISPLFKKILEDPEAAEKLRQIIMKEAEDNILEFEGRKYEIDDGRKGVSSFYERKRNSLP